MTDLVVKDRPERGELWVGEFVALVVRSSIDFSSKLPLSELSMSYLYKHSLSYECMLMSAVHYSYISLWKTVRYLD